MKINKIIIFTFILFTSMQDLVSEIDFGGFGNIGIKTGDIDIGDLNFLTFDINHCENSISSACDSGSVCNVTVGPCVVKTAQKLNAAPTEIDFSRFLFVSNPFIITVNEPGIIPLFNLNETNNYITIIQSTFVNAAYMFVALPTESERVNGIKNLPMRLSRYLKQKTGSFVKVYRKKGTKNAWSEIAEIKIGKSLDDTIMKRSNIINMEIIDNGDLVLTYRNLKREDGSVISITRVTYTSDSKYENKNVQ